jgi:hypothetical protein
MTIFIVLITLLFFVLSLAPMWIASDPDSRACILLSR